MTRAWVNESQILYQHTDGWPVNLKFPAWKQSWQDDRPGNEKEGEVTQWWCHCHGKPRCKANAIEHHAVLQVPQPSTLVSTILPKYRSGHPLELWFNLLKMLTCVNGQHCKCRLCESLECLRWFSRHGKVSGELIVWAQDGIGADIVTGHLHKVNNLALSERKRFSSPVRDSSIVPLSTERLSRLKVQD